MGKSQSTEEDYSDQEYLDFDSKLIFVTAMGPKIKVITEETLRTAQEEDLCRIMEMLSVKKYQARRLLIFHRWDIAKLFAEFVKKERTLFFTEAGVSEEEYCDSGSSAASSIMCEICMEDVPCDQATRMDCSHCFCNDCWREHFIVKINEGQSRLIRCMAYKCKCFCDEDVVRALVSQKSCDMAEKFERVLLESYIENNKRAKWCPSSPHCGNAIYVEDDDGLCLCEVECACGFQFCFGCLSEPHLPCSCLMRELWAEKCQDEHSANWIKNNTKSCPDCQKLVYKDGGCTMVTCICGKTFSWRADGDHKDQEEKGKEPEQDERRYAYYYDRYIDHIMKSLDKDCRLLESIGNKISYPRFCSWLDGLSTLMRSRQFLSCTYPFAFYMFKDGMSDEEMKTKHGLFEHYQQQLEKMVERLYKILKYPFGSDIIMQIADLSACNDRRCKAMYKFIQDDLLGSLSHGTHRIAPYKILKPWNRSPF